MKIKKELPEIDFSKSPAKYWSIKTRIEYLQRRIAVYSILYYNFDYSAITDFEYNGISQQLARMMKENPIEAMQSRYAYAYDDFDGSTGYDIPHRLVGEDKSNLFRIANNVKNCKVKKKGKNKK